MSVINLMLTADYEVWGDGSGRVDTCVIEPAARMMAIAENFNAHLTFFMDLCEYWAFEEAEKEGRFKNGYRPATMMREQLTEAVKRGHDVQLHFHPQWLDASLDSNEKWNLDFRFWRLPLVADAVNKRWDLDKLFTKGCSTLEDLFKPVKGDYKVTTFRAGAWCIQPEDKILPVLREKDILIDSTVIPGMKLNDGRTVFDFTKCNDLPHWESGKKVTEGGNSGVFEVPITSARAGLASRMYFKWLRSSHAKEILPAACKAGGFSRPANLSARLSKLFSSPRLMLNFSDGATFAELKYITEKAMLRHNSLGLESYPMVAISHPKTFGMGNHLEKYLSWLSRRGDFRFPTFSDYSLILESHKRS